MLNRLLLAEANQWPEDVRQYFGDDDEFSTWPSISRSCRACLWRCVWKIGIR